MPKNDLEMQDNIWLSDDTDPHTHTHTQTHTHIHIYKRTWLFC